MMPSKAAHNSGLEHPSTAQSAHSRARGADPSAISGPSSQTLMRSTAPDPLAFSQLYESTLTREQVEALFRNDISPDSPFTPVTQTDLSIPSQNNAHSMSPNQSSPHMPAQPMEETPGIEPLTRKRPISPDADGFTVVKTKNSRGSSKRPPTTSTQNTQPIPTSNSFAPLRTTKPPPIIMPKELYNQSDVSAYIRQHTTVMDFKIQSNNRDVKVFCSNLEDHQKILEVFRNPASKVAYYTYAPRGNGKNKKYLILGLDLSHPLDSVKSALSHPDLIDIRRLTKTDRTGTKTQIEPILVTFTPKYEYNSHLKTIKHIDNVIVYHKVFKENQTIPQCHRCQRMGHTKNHCNLEHRCVRCAGNHPVSLCPRETTPLNCANCGEEHPASYRACEYRVRLLKRLEERKASKVRQPQFFAPAPPPAQNPWANPTRTAAQLFSQPTAHQLPLPTPSLPNQMAPQPLIPHPPIVSHPPTVDPNYTPRWVMDLTNNFTNMFTAMMTSMNKILEAFTGILPPNGP